MKHIRPRSNMHPNLLFMRDFLKCRILTVSFLRLKKLLKILQVTERFSKLIFISMQYPVHVTGFHFFKLIMFHCAVCSNCLCVK